MSSVTKGKSLLLGIICLLITAVIVTAGVWPLSFDPVNKVGQLQDGTGLRFYGPAIVYSREPLAMRGTAPGAASVTIELLVRPEREIGNGVRSIFTLSNTTQPEQIVIGQWKRELILRVSTGKGDGTTRYREISVDNALRKDTIALITIASSKEKTDIYIDGMLTGRFPRYSIITEGGGLSGRLILGNSPDGNNSWYGILTGLAIYDRTLDGNEIRNHSRSWRQPAQPLFSASNKPIALYLFREHGGDRIEDRSGARNDLIVPTSFRPLRRLVLGMPGKDQLFSRWNLMDAAVNILGFMPLGFFLAAWMLQVKNLPTPHAYAITLSGGFCLSLAIELMQVHIPGRDSSLLDVISNTLGTAIGVFLLRYAGPVLHLLGPQEEPMSGRKTR
jgi:VanZ family protein